MGLLNKHRGATPAVVPAAINPPESALPPPPREEEAPKASAKAKPEAPSAKPATGSKLMDRVKAQLAATTPAVEPVSVEAPTGIEDPEAFAERYPDIDPADLTDEQIFRINAGEPLTPFHGAPAEVAAVPPVVMPDMPKKRGRPAGSKNKKDVETVVETVPGAPASTLTPALSSAEERTLPLPGFVPAPGDPIPTPAEMTEKMLARLAELDVAMRSLRKLLESKDAAVRAALPGA